MMMMIVAAKAEDDNVDIDDDDDQLDNVVKKQTVCGRDIDVAKLIADVQFMAAVDRYVYYKNRQKIFIWLKNSKVIHYNSED